MPGPHGLPRHDLEFSGRTSEEASYGEPRRRYALQAALSALTAGVSGYFFVRAGILEGDWIARCLRGIRDADSLAHLIPSLIVIFCFVFWLFVTLFLGWATVRCLFPRELRIRPRARSIVLRQVPFFGPTTERVFHANQVDAVVLSSRRSRWHDQYWARLRLRLKNGGMVWIDSGRQTHEFFQIADEVAVALRAPLADT